MEENVKRKHDYYLIFFIFQATDYWVSVHTLRTVHEDSILDPDDTLCDVVDDREQVDTDDCDVVIFFEINNIIVPHPTPASTPT
jgi:hypothetical protein